MTTKTFTIDATDLETVKDRIVKLNKKAVKLGISETSISSQIARDEKISRKNEITGKTYTVIKSVLDITVISEDIKFGNYEHIATLDHTVGDLPIIKTVPGQVIPEIYQSAKPHCDHCGILRQRNNTYIFRDSKGYKQVGSACLKEFFGIDPTKKLEWFGSFYELDSNLSGYSEPFETNVRVLSIALAIVEKIGYVSGKTAKEKDMISTFDEVKFILNHHRNLDIDTVIYLKTILLRAIELENDAKELITWGISKFSNDSSEYAHNMRIFLNSEYTQVRYFGYLISVIGAYRKDTEERIKKDSLRFDNEHIGVIGAKVTVDVSVIKIIVLDGNYGRSYMVIMSQAETGNEIIWFSSNNILVEGEQVKLKGTIKSLNVRDEKNQTQLTRCKVI